MPLTLAYGVTIHRFQGFEGGKDEHDLFQTIVVDPGNKDWEIKHLGTGYSAVSRAKTIGSWDTPHPTDSALHFIGNGLSMHRLQTGKYKQDKTLCKAAISRNDWVKFLHKRARHTKKHTFNKKRLAKIKKTTFAMATDPNNYISSTQELDRRIYDMITNPNKKWKKKKQKKYMLPRHYFS